MKQLFFLSLLCSAMTFIGKAQPGQLLIKKGNQGLYLEHTVAPKEGLYSIGRLYNVHPRHIATYNKIELTGLNIGQLVQIPLTDTNFTQKSTSGVPVYYLAEANKGLAEISNTANKVAVQKLRDWNNLPGENIAAGKKLIVGFLVSKEMAALAANTSLVKEQPAVNQETKTASTNSPQEVKPANNSLENPQQKQTTTDKALTEPDTKQVATQQEQPKRVVAEPVFAKDNSDMPGGNDQGYFKKSFEQQVRSVPVSRNETVTSGVFKTTSGWQDGKYYLLIDKVPSGTIVKITNPENNKAVYAKVLGEMNGIRQNQGLNIRVSNAASAALGIADAEKFIVKLNY